VLFASKALCNQAIYKIIQSEGLGADVVSGGELYTALSADFPAEKMYFHGNNKTPAEIEQCIEAGIGCIVIDSQEEIPLIAAAARAHGKVAEVSLRIKPGVEAHTHEYIMTGANDCKFGLGIEDGQAMKAVRSILSYDSLHLKGLHLHIGSQIFELDAFVIATDVATDFMCEIRRQTGHVIGELNMGGGYGISYTDEDRPLQPFEYVEAMVKDVRRQCAQKDLPMVRVVIEPGRAIVGEAGITLYTIGTIKHIPGIRTYVSVDGGMADNPRHILYGSQYTALLANKPKAPQAQTVTIAGRCCESGDRLIADLPLPECRAGDILAVFSTGAYNYSMASNYNRLPKPAMVLVNEGRDALISKRETYEQLIQNDCVPEWL
jgi:diaminopimelate decarboxylase